MLGLQLVRSQGAASRGSDGIGGVFTASVAGQLKTNGRIFSYGASGAFYEDRFIPREQLFNMRRFIGLTDTVEDLLKRERVKAGFWMVDAFYAERLQAEDHLPRLLLAGAIKPVNNVLEGFDHLPQAIASFYQASRRGKLQLSFEERV